MGKIAGRYKAPRRGRAEAEYVAVASACTQLLRMRQTLKEYGVTCDKVPLLCDNESAIKIAYNLVDHSRTKHIEIMLPVVILRFHMYPPRINLLIFSRSPWMMQDFVT